VAAREQKRTVVAALEQARGSRYRRARASGAAACKLGEPGAQLSAVIARRIRKEQLRSGKAVREATRCGLDAQSKTGGGGRPALMASQQVAGGKAAELQDPEVRAELNRHVRECERECSTGAWLGSIPQA
jgi:hypothetical protein